MQITIQGHLDDASRQNKKDSDFFSSGETRPDEYMMYVSELIMVLMLIIAGKNKMGSAL